MSLKKSISCRTDVVSKEQASIQVSSKIVGLMDSLSFAVLAFARELISARDDLTVSARACAFLDE
mgnify:CR=1 FL=1|jgi:hypothetical protein